MRNLQEELVTNVMEMIDRTVANSVYHVTIDHRRYRHDVIDMSRSVTRNVWSLVGRPIKQTKFYDVLQ